MHYSIMICWSIFISNVTFRPEEFVTLASTEVCVDVSSAEDSSSGNDHLFVNTNRPQCVYEASDSSENELSDTDSNKDDLK